MATTLIQYGTVAEVGPKIAQCQRDSFMRTFESTVIECKEWSIPSTVDNKRKGKNKKKGKKKKASKLYAIELKDTILFPEGGGQPTDTGVLSFTDDSKKNDIEILSVYRSAEGRVLHKSNTQISVGSKVNISVNWTRRYDHMQQHTGQHLISAIFRKELNAPTMSWWMSEFPKSSQIEMKMEGQNSVTKNDIFKCERVINDVIKSGSIVTTHVFNDKASMDKFAAANAKFKNKELPKGAGPLRVIEIPNIEFNTCCGTHLGNTAQLQMIKISSFDVSENVLKINFVAGDRIVNNYQSMHEREREIGQLLSCGNDGYVSNISKMQSDIKSKASLLRAMEKRLIELEIDRFVVGVGDGKGVKCIYEHFVNGNNKMLQGISDGILDRFKDRKEVIFVFFTMGVSTKSGQYIMATNDSKLLSPKNKESKQKILKCIDGRGGGKPGRLQGKANNFKGRIQLFEYVNGLYDRDENDEKECKSQQSELSTEKPKDVLSGLNQIIDILE